MESFNAGTPFVSVVEYGDKTFVNIRQLYGGYENIEQQGILVSMKQFSMLMYHLRAIETSLVEGGNGCVPKETNKLISTLLIDSTCNNEYNEVDTTIIPNTYVYDQISTNETESATRYIPDVSDNNAVDSEAKLPTQRKRTNNAKTETEPKLPKQCKRGVKFLSTKTVREELMHIYCRLFEEQFTDMIMKKCSGCFLNSNQRDQHNVCKLMVRKERIDTCFYDIVNGWDDKMLKEELTKRMWNGSLPYNEEKMYIPKDDLLRNDRWVQKLKVMIEKC